jgi:hypothetical protein
MRKPKKPGTPPGPADRDDAPPGGRALGRARQFALARGLLPPSPPAADLPIAPVAEPGAPAAGKKAAPKTLSSPGRKRTRR